MSPMPVRDARPVRQVIDEEGVAAAIGLKHVAGVLYTYRCTLACAHCCFNCCPDRPDRYTPHGDALEHLCQMHAIDRVVHIAGGEAMMYWDALRRLCREAGRKGVAPHFIETNASFAASPGLARKRLAELRDCGVEGLLISSDPYHQAMCPPAHFSHCLEAAREVFGERNVIAGAPSKAVAVENAAIARDPARLADFTRRNPPLLSGRAGDDLYGMFQEKPLDRLVDAMWHGGEGVAHCAQEFHPETIWEVHIDLHGNILTCCGIILGHTREISLPDLMAQGFLGRSVIVDAVYHTGPIGLLALAERHGYTPRSGYPQKCGLCWQVRRFLRPLYPDAIGPAEIYEEPKVTP